MQSVALFSNSSPFIPLCLRALFTPSRMKGALSFFFHRYPLLLSRCSLDSWQQAEWEWKTHRCLRKTREREREKGVEGCATRFRVLYFVFPVRFEEGVLRRAGKWMSATSTTPCLHSRQIPFIYFPSLIPPIPHSFYRALPCYACPFEWKLVSNHRGIPVDWDRVFLMDNKGRLVMALPPFRR